MSSYSRADVLGRPSREDVDVGTISGLLPVTTIGRPVGAPTHHCRKPAAGYRDWRQTWSPPTGPPSHQRVLGDRRERRRGLLYEARSSCSPSICPVPLRGRWLWDLPLRLTTTSDAITACQAALAPKREFFVPRKGY